MAVKLWVFSSVGLDLLYFLGTEGLFFNCSANINVCPGAVVAACSDQPSSVFEGIYTVKPVIWCRIFFYSGELKGEKAEEILWLSNVSSNVRN